MVYQTVKEVLCFNKMFDLFEHQFKVNKYYQSQKQNFERNYNDGYKQSKSLIDRGKVGSVGSVLLKSMLDTPLKNLYQFEYKINQQISEIEYQNKRNNIIKADGASGLDVISEEGGGSFDKLTTIPGMMAFFQYVSKYIPDNDANKKIIELSKIFNSMITRYVDFNSTLSDGSQFVNKKYVDQLSNDIFNKMVTQFGTKPNQNFINSVLSQAFQMVKNFSRRTILKHI